MDMMDWVLLVTLVINLTENLLPVKIKKTRYEQCHLKPIYCAVLIWSELHNGT